MKSAIIGVGTLLYGLSAFTMCVWGPKLTTYESLIVYSIMIGMSLLTMIAVDVSKIAKSLEKKADPASPQTADEQGKK
ncbi:MAG: hypothetical protein PHC53_01300 [Patescibacteria group bacterium]|nr:hypothetical protein [Patescibacteria group bacterium]